MHRLGAITGIQFTKDGGNMGFHRRWDVSWLTSIDEL